MSSVKPNSGPDAVARLLAGYRPLPGVSDELVDASGAVRPAWRAFINHVAAMSPEEISHRIEQGDQYLRDAGVFFRQYGDGQAERAWPLSHIPVLVHEKEWATITEGLIQRADLLESIVADLYGDQRLVQEGHLPASLVAMSPEWLRPLVGVRPRSGRFLHFIAFEIARGPDGQWWVLGDRVQAPSGAGFALENRVATTRVFPDHYARANIHRLAGFFRAFRDTMNDLRGDTDSRVGILTPGRLNDTYFEHAYIARYLGFMLLEGEELLGGSSGTGNTELDRRRRLCRSWVRKGVCDYGCFCKYNHTLAPLRLHEDAARYPGDLSECRRRRRGRGVSGELFDAGDNGGERSPSALAGRHLGMPI